MKVLILILIVLILVLIGVFIVFDNRRVTKSRKAALEAKPEPTEDEIIRGLKAKRVFSLINRKPCYLFALNKTQNTVLISRSRNEITAKWVAADKIAPYKQRAKYK